MINVQNLTKRYGDLTAIEDVTFNVQKGEILAFLGPNGAGKTTTMRILTCFLPATSGTASVAGYDIFEQPQEVKKHIGYLPESPPLYTEMTVTEYLRFVSKIKGIERRDRAQALTRVLERCALTDVRHRLIGNLSRGYRQRVGLAQALIHNPEVLILDEPTTGLDPKQIIEMREVIKELAGQHTVILSTHILPEATAVCQRVVIIHKGRIVAVDTPDTLSAQLRQSEKIRLTLRTPSPETAEALKTVPGVVSIFQEPSTDGQVFMVECELGRDIRTELAAQAVRRGWGLLELTAVKLSLEDVFLQLTQEESNPEEPKEAVLKGDAA
ncbi:MAG TPA: ATP-binding cassette domain-containing protein [Nitrospiria bacterium]|jgi:ABC-2 type transport system ATP-binding protein|nr:ATP-binding cassette domain-containing protein [Nitrospiria bacterium]